jgi:hypothetical protein
VKKPCIAAVCLSAAITAAAAQELQVSGGADFGSGFFAVDNSFDVPIDDIKFIASPKSQTGFFAPGISFMMRLYPEKPAGSLGAWEFFFRDRALFLANAKVSGSVTADFPNWSPVFPPIVRTQTEKISKTYSIADSDFSITIMDFGAGLTARLAISGRFMFFADIGINVTVVNSSCETEGTTERNTLLYMGFGVCDELGAQMNLTGTMYVELVSVHKVGYFADRRAFSHLRGYENAFFKVVCL